MVDIEQIIRYEAGEITEEEVVELFQNLIDTGIVWTLQGNYGRMAKFLLDEGLCHSKKELN